MAPTLGYWPVRGLIDPIRFLLAHVEQEYELKLYPFGPAPEFDKNAWRSQQNTLGLDFPNLPYYIDGDLKVTQTLAILRHLARKNGLVGSSEEELIRVDMFEQAIWEILLACFRAWRVGDEASKSELAEYLPGKLEQIQKSLGSGKFILGDKLTHADFLLYSTLDYIRILQAPCMPTMVLDNFQGLKDFLGRIESLPGVEKFIKSDKFTRMPITGPMYACGGQKEC